MGEGWSDQTVKLVDLVREWSASWSVGLSNSVSLTRQESQVMETLIEPKDEFDGTIGRIGRSWSVTFTEWSKGGSHCIGGLAIGYVQVQELCTKSYNKTAIIR